MAGKLETHITVSHPGGSHPDGATLVEVYTSLHSIRP